MSNDMQLKDKVKMLDDKILYQCCNDIELWQSTGVLPKPSILLKLVDDYNADTRDLENAILDEVVHRHKALISMILKNRINDFLK